MTKKYLQPLSDRMIVKTIGEDRRTPGGVVLPDQAIERPIRGKVLAVGEGRWSDPIGERVPMSVEAGDTVIFSKFGGAEIKIGDEELVVLRENDVLAIEREDPPEPVA